MITTPGRRTGVPRLDVVLAAAPEVEKFATRAGRTIPVAVLRPFTESTADGQ